ncbi:MAG: hypothetical protein OXB88_08540 [Bacteriovoracales bacterium]|nr:hypothetical protein [Bacteriovoracales bacterium]
MGSTIPIPIFLISLLCVLHSQNIQSSAQNILEKQQIPSNALEKIDHLEEQKRLEEFKYKERKNQRQKERENRPAPKPHIGPRFLVKRILVSQSKILDREEIAKVIAKYEGRYLNVIELQQIVRDINQIYASKLGFLSQATLPPQKIKNGVVKIILIESKMGRVIFEDTFLTSPIYLKWALPLKKDTQTNLKSLEKMLIRFNKTNNSVRVSSRLRPGAAFGETDIIIEVSEVKRWNVLAFVDNSGSKTTGKFRYGFTSQNNSLIGLDDQLFFGGTKSSGQFSGFLSYDFPFTPLGSRAKATYSMSRQKIVGGSFSSLDIEGKSSILSAKLSHPFLATLRWKVVTGFELVRQIGENNLESFLLKNTVRRYSPFLSVAKEGRGMSTLGKISFHRALKKDGIGSFSKNHKWYRRWTTRISHHHLLPYHITMVTGLNGQFDSDFALPVSEQFHLGGDNNKAYESAEFSGDRGYAFSLDFRYDLPWQIPLPQRFRPTKLKVSLSFERGKLSWYQPNGQKAAGLRPIESLALGLHSKMGSLLSGKITFAAPLKKSHHPNRKTRGFLFSLQGHY